MFVSTTVVSSRILRPFTTWFCLASSTTRSWIFSTSSGPNANPQRPIVLASRSEEHTSELQSLRHLVCRLLLEKKKKKKQHSQIGINENTGSAVSTRVQGM